MEARIPTKGPVHSEMKESEESPTGGNWFCNSAFKCTCTG